MNCHSFKLNNFLWKPEWGQPEDSPWISLEGRLSGTKLELPLSTFESMQHGNTNQSKQSGSMSYVFWWLWQGVVGSAKVQHAENNIKTWQEQVHVVWAAVFLTEDLCIFLKARLNQADSIEKKADSMENKAPRPLLFVFPLSWNLLFSLDQEWCLSVHLLLQQIPEMKSTWLR